MSHPEPSPFKENPPRRDLRRKESPGLLDRFDPRAFVGVAAAAMGIVLVLGFLTFFQFARRQTAPTSPPLFTATLPFVAFTETAGPTSTSAPQSTPPPGAGIPLDTPTPDAAATSLAATITNIPDLRFATLSELAGAVRIKSGTMPDWVMVDKEITILPGTAVLTDENSSVKITFSDGSIVRLSSQTQFTLAEMSGMAGDPLTRIKLEFGKLWAIVGRPVHGQFIVQMPVGVASVRGTFMSAEYNSTDRLEVVTCLEGFCRYENSNGGADLTTHQQTESIDGGAPSAPHRMDRNQVEDWRKQKIPEVSTLTPTRTPSNTPTQTFTPSLTFTASDTFTPSPTVPTNTPTATLTPTKTNTPTSTFTFTPTSTFTSTPTRTPGPAVQLGFIVQPPPTATAGAPFTVKVAIQDASGATVPYASATITISIGTNPGGGALSGTTSVGTLNGVAEFPNLSIDKAGSGYTLVASVTGLTSATSVAFDVAPASAASLVVAGIPPTVTAGTASSVTVTAKDSLGNTVTGYTGTVTFTSNDPQAALPASYTFTAGDAGVRTFSVTLKTAGSRSVTATDTTNGSVTGTQSGITVNAGQATTFKIVILPTSPTVNTPADITVNAVDAYDNLDAAYSGTVEFDSFPATAILPAPSPVTGGTRTFAGGITFTASGAYQVTANDFTNSIFGTPLNVVVAP